MRGRRGSAGDGQRLKVYFFKQGTPLAIRGDAPLRLGVGLDTVPHPRVMCSKEPGQLVQRGKEAVSVSIRGP